MIVDSHMHLGEIMRFTMTEEIALSSINKYNIDFGIISNGESAEFDNLLNIIPNEFSKSQIDSNNRTLNFVKSNFSKFRGQFWIKPHTEGMTNEIIEYITENRKYFTGIKMHPYHSKMKVTDEKVIPYIELAQNLNMSFALHTAGDIYSDPKLVYEIGQKYPKVKFILVHLGLGTDNNEAIDIVASLPNLYGDSTWVTKENVLKAIKICGSHKILFGTDAPIDGIDTYSKYLDMIEFLKQNLPKDDFEMFIYKNAANMFELDIK